MEKITQTISYTIDFITQTPKTASDYDYPDRLLAPTMTTLLQQQARGIGSGSS